MRLLRLRRATVPPAVAAAMDQLADTYWADPNVVADLLIQHGQKRLALDALVIDPHAEPWQIAVATAETDGARAALLTYCTTTEDHR